MSEYADNTEPRSEATDDTINHLTGERPVSRVRLIPEAYRNIQVNFCKTPGCPNLCVEPLLGRIRSGRQSGSDGYRVVGVRTDSRLHCSYCGVESRIKSNRAIDQEFRRQAAPLFAPSPLICPTEGCPADPRHPTKAFQKFGRSAAGALRFRCRSCKATFSVPGPTARQHRTVAGREPGGLSLVLVERGVEVWAESEQVARLPVRRGYGRRRTSNTGGG